jgi:hypothetical protein
MALERSLTVKLRGRPTTPDKRRGRTLSPGARGANQTTHHGPLQRLLDSMPQPYCVAGWPAAEYSAGSSVVMREFWFATLGRYWTLSK